MIQEAYEDFKSSMSKIVAEADVMASKDHSPIVEVSKMIECDYSFVVRIKFDKHI